MVGRKELEAGRERSRERGVGIGERDDGNVGRGSHIGRDIRWGLERKGGK